MVTDFIHLPLYRFYTQTFRTLFFFLLRISDKLFLKGYSNTVRCCLFVFCCFLLRIQEIQIRVLAKMITKYQGDA